jgi:hypothetical protein
MANTEIDEDPKMNPEKYINLRPSPQYYVIEAVCAAVGVKFDGFMPKVLDARSAAQDAVGSADGLRLEEMGWQNNQLLDYVK